jgi:hypothetical protein
LRASEKQEGNPLEKQVGNGFSMLAVTLGRFRLLVFDLEPTTEKQSPRGSLLQRFRMNDLDSAETADRVGNGDPDFQNLYPSVQVCSVRSGTLLSDEIGQSRSSLNSDSELRLRGVRRCRLPPDQCLSCSNALKRLWRIRNVVEKKRKQ